MNKNIEETIAEKIIEKCTADIEKAAVMVRISNEIYPEIDENIQKSGRYIIPFDKIVQKYKSLTEEYISIGSIFCGLVTALWHKGIDVHIVLNDKYCILLLFYGAIGGDLDYKTKDLSGQWKELYMSDFISSQEKEPLELRTYV